jgi:class 3 adenylate cyclase
MAGSLRSLPFPDDPMLAAWASALNDAGYWAWLLDDRWRYVWLTDELRLSFGDTGDSTVLPIGSHYFSAEAVRYRSANVRGFEAIRESRRVGFADFGRYVLASTPGGREELRQVIDPEFADLVDELEPEDLPVVSYSGAGMTFAGREVGTDSLRFRIDDREDRFVGLCYLIKPAVGMSQLAAAAATADLRHLERMRIVEHPDRHPAAILMADLEASSPLARRLSTAQYFAFARRWVRATDQCVVDAGGIVGRHAGDGLVAYFLAETAGSESAAVRACITSARALRGVLGDVAARSDIPAAEVSLRFGLHWGATLYMGSILTAGRSEVTALGDEMNEAARIEACATGGRALASKSLIERLDHADAQALGIETRQIAYTPLAELATATDKARRDAPAIAVCEV